MNGLLARAGKHPEAGLFGTTIAFGERPDIVWFCGGRISIEDGVRAVHQHIGERVEQLPSESFYCDYLTGANLFGKMNSLDIVGLIPEEYFLYFEDADWCIRLGRRGLKAMVFPDLVMYHWKRSEQKDLPTERYLYYYCRNSGLDREEILAVREVRKVGTSNFRDQLAAESAKDGTRAVT